MEFQERINQLEGLVISLMSTLKTKGSESKIASPEPGSKLSLEAEAQPTNFEVHPQTLLSDTFGRISLENAETSLLVALTGRQFLMEQVASLLIFNYP